MKTKLLALFSLVFFTQAAMAQFHLGVKGGVNITKVEGKAFKDEFRYGYHLGGFAEIGLGGKLGIQPEVLWSQNQTSSTYATAPRTGANVLYSTDRVVLNDQLYFQPLSLSTLLKVEYSIGKFFLQPQLIFDYYFPADKNNLTTAVVLNAGVIF